MVGVAQLVEHWIVAPVVEGSNPFTHPMNIRACLFRSNRLIALVGFVENAGPSFLVC